MRYSRFEMPVNVAMEEPWARVIRAEAECDIVTTTTNAEDITARRVHVVVGGTSGGTNNVEGMLRNENIRIMLKEELSKITYTV